MLVAALITGFDEQVQEQIKQFGADTAFISRWDHGPHDGKRPSARGTAAETAHLGGCRRPSSRAARGKERNRESWCGGRRRTRCVRSPVRSRRSIFTACSQITGRCMRTPRPSPGDSSAKATTSTAQKVVMLGESVAPVLFPRAARRRQRHHDRRHRIFRSSACWKSPRADSARATKTAGC